MASQKDVRASLLKQLEDKGANVACYVDLVDDYLKLWGIKNSLVKDIKKRGVVYEDNSCVGVPMKKNNPSVKDLLATNRQMLAILEKLGLSTDKCAPPGGEDDDGGL